MSNIVRQKKRWISIWLCLVMIFTGIQFPEITGKADSIQPWLLSQGRPAYASSVNGGDKPSRATDGDIHTQWGAKWETSDQWLDVDLGATADVSEIRIYWQNEFTYATKYKIQVSEDEINWTTVYEETNGNGGERIPDENGNNYCYENLTVSGTGRYIRLFAQTCVSGFGVAVYEIEIYGIGGVNEPASKAENLALGKTVTASSTAQPWWAGEGEKAAQKAVDGNNNSNWLSEGTNNEWFQVDLGTACQIGRVVLNWEVEYGRVYELQTSLDGQNWTVVYRQIHGNGEKEEISMYQKARYVRMYGIAMGRGSGYSLREIEVYAYEEGAPKINPVLTQMPEEYVVSVGKGSYSVDDLTMAQPREPKYITSNISTPIPSNDWWTSIVYTRLSDGIAALPYMFTYEDTGLGMYYATDLFTAPNNGGMDTKSNNMDITINTSSIVGKPSAKLDKYGDWSVDVVYSDDDTPKMRTTLIKGSPYVYSTFTDPSSVEISSLSITELFDDSGNAILTNDGDSIVADHIGIQTTNTNTAPVSITQTHQYGIYAPEGTTFTRLGSKIKIQLGSGENYLSIGLLPTKSDLSYLYRHAYAFVTDTTVEYAYDNATAMVTTVYRDTIELKRAGFSEDTLFCLMPHQWKYSGDTFNDNLVYASSRGRMRVHEGRQFTYSLRFQGLTPSFGEPVESSSYDRETMTEYLQMFVDSATTDYWVADPYWQGKKTHPICMGILIAQQLGEYQTRDELLGILKKILENWLTYDGDDDYPYYLYYSTSWGTLSGDGGDHGMAINLSDHHFLWSYFIFPAAILATYDADFAEGYGGMVEHLIRDCMNPDKNDDLYPFMRNFDPYEGHSWAGGYGDNQSGNNQESASEATFAWAGLYLWGLVTGNDTYRDAGIWGFTSEVNAIEQYWFNYDGDNWSQDYTSGCVGMVWGSAYTNGTYFSGNPSCIYGIHMLPVTPILTYLGYDPDKAAEIYRKYEHDQEVYQAKVESEGQVDPEGWFHILWPYQALSDPDGVMEKWDISVLPNDETFNTYWYVQNMAAKGFRAVDVWSSDYTGYQIFRNMDGEYSAVVWNPFDTVQRVTFCNETGTIGYVYVQPKTTVTVNPFEDNDIPMGEEVPDADLSDTVHTLPCVIEAEDYYTNFSCSLVDVSEGGKGVGYIDDGDSLVYKINVPDPGEYIVEYRIISNSQTEGEFRLKTDAHGVIDSTQIPYAKGWRTVSTRAVFSVDDTELTLIFVKGNYNINWLRIYKEGTIPPEVVIPDNPGGDTGGGVNINDDLSDYTAYRAIGASASTESGANTAAMAVDWSASTRWESAAEDPQWIMADLGKSKTIGGIKINWETAAAKSYIVQVSENGTDWNDAYIRTNGCAGTDSIRFESEVTGRYIRVYGTERTTGYGYSVWEMTAYGPEKGETEEPEKPVTDNLALNKPTKASSLISDDCDASMAVDGSEASKWNSVWDVDPQWIMVDLQVEYEIDRVILKWADTAASAYEIQVSADGDTWNTVYEENSGDGGTDDITFTAAKARYVKVYGTKRLIGYGYALNEFEVYGKAAGGEEINGYTVTFMDGNTLIESKNCGKEGLIQFAEAPKADGKLFAGWYTEEVTLDSAQAVTAAASKAALLGEVSRDTVFYAGWIEIGTIAKDSADTSAPGDTVNAFEVAGVQIRTSGQMGMRFITRISTGLIDTVEALHGDNAGLRPESAQDKGIGYGTVAMMASNLNGQTLVKDENAAYVASGMTVCPAINNYQEYGDYLLYTCVVTGIPARYYKEDIAVRPYITYKDANGAEHTYYYTETSPSSGIGSGYKTNLYAAAQAVYNLASTSEGIKNWLKANILDRA